MATKIESKKKDDQAEDDLAILHPEREVIVGGRKVVVREYGFIEGMRLRVKATPFIEGLYAVMKDNASFSYEQVLDVFSRFNDDVLAMAAQAANVDKAWVEKLDPAEGDAFLLVWWAVNQDFFYQGVYRRQILEKSLVAANA